MEKSKEGVIAFDKLKAHFIAVNQRRRDYDRLKHRKLLEKEKTSVG
jgi:hypothetical protein